MDSSYINSVMPNVYYSLIVTGIIILFCLTGSSLAATMAGYSFIIAGLIIMVAYLVNGIQSIKSSRTGVNMLYTISPLLTIMGLIIYILYLLGIYFDRITGGHVSSGYYTFSQISSLIMLLQFIIFHYATLKPQFKTEYAIPSSTSLMLILLTILNAVSVYTIYLILTFYSTDG
jgi:hypothetical protein